MRVMKFLASLGVVAVALAPALSGCTTVGMAEAGSNLGSQMQANVSSGFSNVGGMIGGKPDAPGYSTQVFVASTRRGGDNSTELTPGARARYALDMITVPPGHEAGHIERPSWGAPDPNRHVALASQSALDDEQFRSELAAHVSGRVGAARDVLVYVHGFNTSLNDARFRLAQLVVDGNFAGVPILFTWPSKSALLAYGADKESATASRDAYLKLLQDVAATPGVGRVHILAHSMGTWLTMETLREAALSGSPDLNGRLGNVMLAAPDIDLSVFKQQVARLDATHFSVFVSKGDRALQLSAGLQGDRRLGSLDPSLDKDRELIESLGVKVFDISQFSSGFIGHDNYGDAPQVVSQIGASINAPRAADAEQAVIDAGADRSVRADPRAITASDLPAPGVDVAPAK
jgi:esterase/lipase superfamily enzyme